MIMKTLYKSASAAGGLVATIVAMDILPDNYKQIAVGILGLLTVLGVHYAPYHGIYRNESDKSNTN